MEAADPSFLQSGIAELMAVASKEGLLGALMSGAKVRSALTVPFRRAVSDSACLVIRCGREMASTRKVTGTTATRHTPLARTRQTTRTITMQRFAITRDFTSTSPGATKTRPAGRATWTTRAQRGQPQARAANRGPRMEATTRTTAPKGPTGTSPGAIIVSALATSFTVSTGARRLCCPRILTFARPVADRYVVEKKLGWGHFSTVWLARDTTNDRVVALKVQKSAEHYTEAAYDEIHILETVAERATELQKEKQVEKSDSDGAGGVGSSSDASASRATPSGAAKSADSSEGAAGAAAAEAGSGDADVAVVRLVDHFFHNGPNGKHACMAFERLGPNLREWMSTPYP